MSDPSPRLYLIAPPPGAAAAASSRLADALAAGDVACVLFPAPVEAGLAETVRMVQSHGAAALLGDATLATVPDADGVHVAAGPGLRETVRRMKPSRIVGVGGLLTRDDAMTAGEEDIDYVMLGDGPAGTAPAPFAERLDQVSWWAEIFQVPCVAMAFAPGDVGPLIESGAEFVGLDAVVWSDPRGAAAAVGDAMAALRQGHAAYLARQAERVR